MKEIEVLFFKWNNLNQVKMRVLNFDFFFQKYQKICLSKFYIENKKKNTQNHQFVVIGFLFRFQSMPCPSPTSSKKKKKKKE